MLPFKVGFQHLLQDKSFEALLTMKLFFFSLFLSHLGPFQRFTFVLFRVVSPNMFLHLLGKNWALAICARDSPLLVRLIRLWMPLELVHLAKVGVASGANDPVCVGLDDVDPQQSPTCWEGW